MMQTRLSFVKCTLLLLLGPACWSATQERKALQIDSPRNGAVVHPGDKVTFAISSPSGTAVQGVFVLGEGGIVGDSPARLPAQILVSIPARLAPGKYAISAVGMAASGQEITDEIVLDVEMPNSPAHEAAPNGAAIVEKLKAEPSPLILQTQGQRYPIRFIATYTNGQDVDVSESSRLVLRSANPNVATVNSEHMVTAVDRGSTTITAIYLESGRSVNVNLPVTVEAEIIRAVPSTLNFGGVPVGKSVQQQVLLTYNTDNPTLRIIDIKISGDFSQTSNCLSSSTARKESTCTVTVTFAPTMPGTRRGDLSLQDNWSIAPTTIPLTGRAVAQ